MIRSVQSRFSDALLAEAAYRFAMNSATLTTLDGYENLVYSDDARVLRISHDGIRDPEQVLGECRFIAYLAAGGASVASALRSREGALLERLPDGHGSHFLATCFERAPGRPLERGDDTVEVIESLGALAATMHRLSAGYQQQGTRREAWYENTHVADWHTNTADEAPALRANIEALYQRLRDLPNGPEHAGLIHGDLHGDNVLWDGERLTAIDFDDCLVGPWGMDLGTCAFYCRRLLPAGHDRTEEEQRAYILSFVESFVRGYCRLRPLDDVARRHFADFVRWRQVDLFLFLHHLRLTSGLDDEELGHLERMRGDIERGLSPLLLEDERLLAAVAAGSA